MASLTATVKVGNPGLQSAAIIPVSSQPQVTRAVSLTVRASAEERQTRRAALASIATVVASAAISGNASALAPVSVGPPPPPIGGLPGTESSDQARDFEAPLKERFFIQPLDAPGALKRAKDALAVLPEIESYIERKAWPYVRNELRSELGYLRFDLATVASSKAKAEKKALLKEIDSIVDTIEKLDYAARAKVQGDAKKYFATLSSDLPALLSKLG